MYYWCKCVLNRQYYIVQSPDSGFCWREVVPWLYARRGWQWEKETRFDPVDSWWDRWTLLWFGIFSLWLPWFLPVFLLPLGKFIYWDLYARPRSNGDFILFYMSFSIRFIVCFDFFFCIFNRTNAPFYSTWQRPKTFLFT